MQVDVAGGGDADTAPSPSASWALVGHEAARDCDERLRAPQAAWRAVLVAPLQQALKPPVWVLWSRPCAAPIWRELRAVATPFEPRALNRVAGHCGYFVARWRTASR